MLKKLFYLSALLMLCNSCVSRVTNEEPGLTGENESKINQRKEIIWFWDKDF